MVSDSKRYENAVADGFSRQATPAEIRAYYKADGFKVRIGRDGHVKFEVLGDRWRDGAWVHHYRWYDGIGVVLT